MYRGIDLGEAISISGSKAMADKIMEDKEADTASRGGRAGARRR